MSKQKVNFIKSLTFIIALSFIAFPSYADNVCMKGTLQSVGLSSGGKMWVIETDDDGILEVKVNGQSNYPLFLMGFNTLLSAHSDRVKVIISYADECVERLKFELVSVKKCGFLGDSC